MGLRTLFQKETAALLVEEDGIRLVVATGGQVARWGAAKFSAGTVVRGEVRKVKNFAEAVQKLFAAQNVSRDRVILGLSGIGSASHLMPVHASGDLQRVRQRAEQWLPTHEYQLAWQPVARKGGSSYLFLVATPHRSLESHLLALQEAEVEPVAVDLKPLCLVRAVGQQNALLVDLERTLMTLAIIEGAVPQKVRVLPLDFPSVRTPEDKITRMVDEWQRLIARHNREVSRGRDGHTGTQIHAAMPVWISGSLADHPLFRTTIREALEHPCVVPPSPLPCPKDMPVAQYLACLGLAMKQI